MINESALVVRSMDDAIKAGRILAESRYFRDVTTVAQATAKVMAGAELGIAAMASMTGVHIIDGKTALGSNLIAAQIQRSGRFKYRIRAHNAKECKIEFFEKDGDKWEALGISEFTLEMAARAGLLTRKDPNPWKRYPEAMVFSRAISSGARLHTPSIFAGPVYTPEELSEIETPSADAANEKAQPVLSDTSKANESSRSENSKEDKKIRQLPDKSIMVEIQNLSRSLALTNNERVKLRERAGTWDKAAAGKNLADLKKLVEERKASGVQAGQTEFISTLMADNEAFFSPAEITSCIEAVHKSNSFADAAGKIRQVIAKLNERIKEQSRQNQKTGKAAEVRHAETQAINA
jgi:hypothetical protein